MKKFLLIGGLGFVGKNVSLHLLKQGHEITIFDIKEPTQQDIDDFNSDAVKFLSGDVTNKNDLNLAFEDDYDGVFHLASFVGIKNYISNPSGVILTTILGTNNVAQKCIDNNVHLLFTSTSEVLGKNSDTPWKEDADRVYGSTMKDRWSYGSSKGVAEQIIIGLGRSSKLSYTITRFFNIYGDFQNPIFVVPKTISNCMKNQPPLLYDSGKQTRCFTYVKDAVVAVEQLMERKSNGIFHIGSNFEHSVEEVINKTIEILNVDLSIEHINTDELYSGKYEDIYKRVPDVEKVFKEIGWRATTELSEGLSQTIKWARKNHWWLELNSDIKEY